MTQFKQITIKRLRNLSPCYDPTEIGIPENYRANISRFIKDYRNLTQSKDDMLWVLLRPEFLSDRLCRLFAVWCARKALKLIDDPDKRSINACNVAEKFANGKATKEELAAARDAARAAAWDAARTAAWAAARAAAWDAARTAQIDKLITIFETNEVTFNDL